MTITMTGEIVAIDFRHMNQKDRLKMIQEMLETIDENGWIDEIRELVNRPAWDDVK